MPTAFELRRVLEDHYSAPLPPNLQQPRDDDNEPPPPPPPPPPTPNESWTKPDIVAWLFANGVAFTDEVLLALTKAELLTLVELVLNDQVDQVPAAIAEMQAES